MFYTNDIDHLIKNIDCINYFDIGSREDGEKGWIDLINSKLKKINFEAEDNTGLFNEKKNGILYLTKEKSQSSLFEPNKILNLYELQSTRLEYTKKEINLDTIDNKFLNSNTDCDLIKIDTQGSEYEILEGGLNYINKKKPFLFLETWMFEYYKNIKSFDKIISLLETINYQVYSVDKCASLRINLKDYFTKNIGGQQITGLNLFCAPKIDDIKYLDYSSRSRRSFLFFVHNLLTHSYYLVKDDINSKYRTELKKIINKRIKYKFFYKLYSQICFLKFRIFGNSNKFYKLT